jgi:methionine-rich copper-binding protein CopC
MSILCVRPRLSRMRTAAIALAAAWLLALGATTALAHDPLAATNSYMPAGGSVVAGELPATIIVNFQNPFRQAGSATDANIPVASVLDSSGVNHIASAVQNPNDAKQLVLTTKHRTTPGKYTVTWTITAADGDVVSNNGGDVFEEGSPLVFTVGNSGRAAANASTPTPAAKSSSNTAIATTIGVVIVVLIAAGAVVFWFRRRHDNMSQESDS